MLQIRLSAPTTEVRETQRSKDLAATPIPRTREALHDQATHHIHETDPQVAGNEAGIANQPPPGFGYGSTRNLRHNR